jgi:hypothetical protein
MSVAEVGTVVDTKVVMVEEKIVVPIDPSPVEQELSQSVSFLPPDDDEVIDIDAEEPNNNVKKVKKKPKTKKKKPQKAKKKKKEKEDDDDDDDSEDESSENKDDEDEDEDDSEKEDEDDTEEENDDDDDDTEEEKEKDEEEEEDEEAEEEMKANEEKKGEMTQKMDDIIQKITKEVSDVATNQLDLKHIPPFKTRYFLGILLLLVLNLIFVYMSSNIVDAYALGVVLALLVVIIAFTGFVYFLLSVYLKKSIFIWNEEEVATSKKKSKKHKKKVSVETLLAQRVKNKYNRITDLYETLTFRYWISLVLQLAISSSLLSGIIVLAGIATDGNFFNMVSDASSYGQAVFYCLGIVILILIITTVAYNSINVVSGIEEVKALSRYYQKQKFIEEHLIKTHAEPEEKLLQR